MSGGFSRIKCMSIIDLCRDPIFSLKRCFKGCVEVNKPSPLKQGLLLDGSFHSVDFLLNDDIYINLQSCDHKLKTVTGDRT